MHRSPQWIDLYQIWFRGSSRGRNQLCGILLQSAYGFRICEESKFAISRECKPGVFQTRVYGLYRIQTRVPGFDIWWVTCQW